MVVSYDSHGGPPIFLSVIILILEEKQLTPAILCLITFLKYIPVFAKAITMKVDINRDLKFELKTRNMFISFIICILIHSFDVAVM